MTIAQGNALRLPLRDESVHCVVTSPPYWSLRDYNTPGQLGLEPTIDAYVANMVDVFREVWRVLRNDGTVWLNLGDSYAQASSRSGQNNSSHEYGHTDKAFRDKRYSGGVNIKAPSGLKPKDLCGIPWRVALALQADGWWLRSDVIWAKPNPMPESVTDRPTKSHEYVFLLTKRSRYFYDADAVREGVTGNAHPQGQNWQRPKSMATPMGQGIKNNRSFAAAIINETAADLPTNRNRRTVWTIATEPYSGAHFATFPQALVEPCIKAGTSEHGCCPVCGAGWERVVERGEFIQTGRLPTKYGQDGHWKHQAANRHRDGHVPGKFEITTTGFRPTCDHDADPIPATVFDPFFGSGTTGLVARRLGRRFVGVDLSREYLQLARERLGLSALDAWNSGDGKVADDDMSGLPLFEVTP